MKGFGFRSGLVAAIACLTLLSCSNAYHSEIIAAGPLGLTVQWQEIALSRPLSCNRDTREVLLDTSATYEIDTRRWGFRLPDGTVAVPEVQIVTDDGRTYDLVKRGFSNRTLSLSSESLPGQATYTHVRARCNTPVEVTRLTWACYNYRDVAK